MQIDGFGSILMKTIGIGVALVDRGSNRLAYRNPAFAALFEAAQPGAVLAEVCGDLDDAAIRRGLAGGAIALTVRVRRRQVALEVQIREAEFEGRQILVIECQNVSRLRETEAMIDSYASMTERRARELEREKAQVEKLLLNVMPRSVYEEYKTFGTVTPRLFEPVSVLMLDFVGFTEMAVAADPTETVSELNELFTAFDRIAELNGCERIKTVGDCYMAVSGLPHPNPDHARLAARCALSLVRFLRHRNRTHRHKWEARIGIASGSVVGSVVGIQKYIYDVFGPAVNCAARLQALSAPMEITVPAAMALDLDGELRVSGTRTESLRGFGSVEVATLHVAEPALARLA
ncbi:MAG: adenylate/guanylate cyclase domain-containing protein [Pseudooceanicola sp.]|nr:adenylate/guanylate cyclase domain-containing protein [Pseudooceanicola sp.]